MSLPALLESGHAALARGAWEDARAAFEQAAREGGTPEALEGLGTAAWWRLDYPAAIAARELAYQAYREQGDAVAAARVACWLASDHMDRGDLAVSSGWLQRAERLLEDRDPTPEHAFLGIMRGHLKLMADGDPDAALELARTAKQQARAQGHIDFEMLAQALEGLALVTAGDVQPGMRALDEATAAATGGDMSDLNAIGWACCYLIHACYRVRDYDRAAQWCERVQDFCRRWRFDSMFTTCRTHYASILMWRGKLGEAETELAELQREARDTLPPLVRSAIVRLGELRRRQGRLDEAEELFGRAPDHKLALLGRASLALDRGDARTAIELMETFLRRLPEHNRTERLAALEILLRARIAAGELDRAEQAAAELREIAEAVNTEPIRGASALGGGLLAAARGEHDQARHCLSDAVYLLERNNAAYEAARARLDLALVLADHGRRDAAREAATRGRDAFQAMDAHLLAEQAARVLAGLRDRPERDGSLTRREREVLTLVARGMTDKEIAADLGISEHTVHRHVSNILTKTSQSSRAAAVAHAAREGLI